MMKAPVVSLSLALMQFAAAGTAPAATLDQYFVVEGKTTEVAGVSGYPSRNVTNRQPGNSAVLYGIGGGERGDEPCYVELSWSRKIESEQRLFGTKFWQPPCSDEHHSYEATRLMNPTVGVGIGEINVCTNDKSNNRLKGVKITLVRSITATGNPDVEVNPDIRPVLRPNCAQWHHPSRCADNKIAIGVNIHHDGDGVSALQLVCATVKMEVEAPPPVPEFALDPTATPYLTPVSGMAGKEIRVGAPGNASFGVYQLVSYERRDHPCHLDVFSTVTRRPLVELPKADMFYIDAVDRCGEGNQGDQLLAVLGLDHTVVAALEDSLYQVFLSGLRICTNNQGTRLKGLQLRARAVLVDGNAIRLQDVALADDDGVERANCNDNWKRWVNCPDGQVASAVLAHLEDGTAPRSVSGLGLECRRVLTGG